MITLRNVIAGQEAIRPLQVNFRAYLFNQVNRRLQV